MIPDLSGGYHRTLVACLRTDEKCERTSGREAARPDSRHANGGDVGIGLINDLNLIHGRCVRT